MAVIAIIYTEDVMNIREIKTECRDKQFIPVLVYHKLDDPTPNIPLFVTSDTALTFIRRNMKPGQVMAGYRLAPEDVTEIEKQGWRMEVMTFPRKMMKLPGIKVGVEVLRLAHKPEIEAF
jgi:hypothetical protein